MSDSKQLAGGFQPGSASMLANQKESAAEEYYRLQLLKEKFGNTIAYTLSEKDQLKADILDKIRLVSESSPEWYELVSTTGSENQYEQAEYLASTAIAKRKAERALEKYTGGARSADRIFDESARNANRFRAGAGAVGGFGNLLGEAAEGRSGPLAEALREQLGLGVAGTARRGAGGARA
jgi:hypothetical protein